MAQQRDFFTSCVIVRGGPVLGQHCRRTHLVFCSDSDGCHSPACCMTTRIFARSRFSTVVWMASRSSDERQMPRTRAAACLGALVPALRAVLPCRRPLGLRDHHSPILNLQVYMPMVNAVGYPDNGYCRMPLHVKNDIDSSLTKFA